MNTVHHIYFGDSQHMRNVQSEEAHLIVTSPPYGSIKDYNHAGQIGYGDCLPNYFEKLNNVWTECLRALKPGGRLCINIGDQYVRASKGMPYQILPLHAYLVSNIMDEFADQVLPLGSIIWKKIPTTKTTGGANVMGSYPYPRNGYVSYNYEYIAIFKKYGETPIPEKEEKAKAKINLKEWRKLFNGIWEFRGAKQVNGIAVFPDELPRRLMQMFTFEGDTVLDPFLGSGTTTRVAWSMARNSIGYEINPNRLKEIYTKCHYFDTSEAEREKVFPTLPLRK